MIPLVILLAMALGISAWMNWSLMKSADESISHTLELVEKHAQLLVRHIDAKNILVLAHLDHDECLAGTNVMAACPCGASDCLAGTNVMAACSCGASDFNAVLDDVLYALQPDQPKETPSNGNDDEHQLQH